MMFIVLLMGLVGFWAGDAVGAQQLVDVQAALHELEQRVPQPPKPLKIEELPSHASVDDWIPQLKAEKSKWTSLSFNGPDEIDTQLF